MTQRVVNYTYGTGNPVLPDGSIDVRDGIDNLQSLDIFMNADEDTYNQRDGEVVQTAAGAVKSVGFKPGSGDFTTGFTVMPGQRNYAWYDPVGKNWYSYLGVIPTGGYSVAPGTNPVSDSNWKPVTDQLLRIDLSGDWPAPLNLSIVDQVGVGDYRIQYNRAEGSLHSGVRDPLPLDDTLNHFRGLPDKDTWGNPDMQGIGSVSFGRNGASYAYLSATYGHDCVVYGAAGFAGGAGSCVGNPDLPLQDAAFGYCSFAYGKMTKAQGRTSNAMGQECQANSLVSSADGYSAIAGPGLASHPNARFPGATNKGVVSEGRAARAYGWHAQAYGDFSLALGAYVRAYNGATVIGSGPDEARPLIASIPGAIYYGAQCSIPAIAMIPDDGTWDKLGLNTHDPRERIEGVLKSGDKVALRTTGGTGNGTFALQGTLGDGSSVDILTIDWNSPNAGSAAGIAVVKINGIPSFTITASGSVDFGSSVGLGGSLFVAGDKVVGAQQPKIIDSLTDSQKIAALLNAVRAHGLINPASK